ncbi:MAG: hypothetical protein A2144_11865 [Chloroflexi bacterium RBG_16_50_9]|nr:MAG: hypothetical protein A2144_11865 [Chloroflexi bacterium RBG_16_50_9]
MARVSLIKTDKDLYASVTKAIDELGQQAVAPGDRVLIKPNLVRKETAASGEITNPPVIEAVARYCLDRGATRVIIGEGPGWYNDKSRLKDCFTYVGIDKMAKRLGIEWVLFDDYNYRAFKKVSDCTPDVFRVTEFVFDCDKIINLPALKTHYLTTVTLAMKNLKGCLKWEDKPLFHQPDLSRAVVELNKIVRPALNIIDGTNRKHGGGLLIASTDIVAADTVGCALMGIDPAKVRMITLGAAAGLGESDITRIEILGEELRQLKFKVKLPQEQLKQNFPGLEIVGAEKACSGCIIPLLSSLSFLSEQGIALGPVRVYLGKNPDIQGDRPWLQVGDCAEVPGGSESNWLKGCPPGKDKLINHLKRFRSI